ncbi:hypothetical protein Slin15195_G019550 [Septoria linicola]|uniref:Uncharacterized protein n=1 Tax=Septoria linicola TaxID=215465 RepID=A0A9Q9AMF8_9PEZI|nr:hypothetical protein Slin14017_G019610 [Septoria linicola]USW48636.1 hypothetical protein Slin15195_G019550 [Septoria linicola]
MDEKSVAQSHEFASTPVCGSQAHVSDKGCDKKRSICSSFYHDDGSLTLQTPPQLHDASGKVHQPENELQNPRAKKRKRKSASQKQNSDELAAVQPQPKKARVCPFVHPDIREEGEDPGNTKPLQPAPPPTVEEQVKWKKHQFGHWDQSLSTRKCVTMNYDELEGASPIAPREPTPDTAGQGTENSKTTCFFWYHGSCARARDPRNGYKCK